MTVSAPSPPGDQLSRGLSLYLEALRLGAAVVVFLAHLADSRLTGARWAGFKDLELGRDAVVVFFVLSGLIIARAATRPGVTGPGFAFDRATRLWSVALPAVVLCWILDRWGAALAPDHYAGITYNEIGLLRSLALGLTFSSEWSPFGELIGSNLPYWSLSHEAAYYALFAVAVFLRGSLRAALLLGGAILAGPGVLAYLPAWLLGVWVWRRLQTGTLPDASAARRLAFGTAIAAIGCIGLGAGNKMLALPISVWGDQAILTMRFGLSAPWGTVLAGLTALHLLGVAGMMRGRAVAERPWLRWAAGGTFSLYLVHQPVMHLLRVRLDWLGDTALRDGALALGTLSVCLVFAALFERTLGAQRRALRSLFEALPTVPRART